MCFFRHSFIDGKSCALPGIEINAADDGDVTEGLRCSWQHLGRQLNLPGWLQSCIERSVKKKFFLRVLTSLDKFQTL